MKSLVVMLMLFASISYSQDRDRKVIFELKTKCMELAKDCCAESNLGSRSSTVSFYDIKRNRCYSICSSMDNDTTNGGRNACTTVILSDVHSGLSLASYVAYWVDQKRSFGYIGDKATSYEKAEAYIKRMTKE